MTTAALPATGAAFGEFGSTGNWKITDTDAAGSAHRWTTTPLRNVDNSSVRDALAVFDSALLASETLLLFAAPRESRIVEIMVERGDVSFDWLREPIAGSIVDAVDEPRIGPLTLAPGVASDEADTEDTLGDRLAVKVIRQLQRCLGLPVRDVLRAAGVSKSTFHSWDKPDGPRPRLASQGRLWALAETVDDLAEHLGGPELVGPWIAADGERRSLLRAGSFDALLERATPAATDGSGTPYLAGLYAAGEEKQPPPTSTATSARERKVIKTTGTSRRMRQGGGSA